MYKLLFSIIIFSVGFSSIAEAQSANNSATVKLVLNKNSKHYSNTRGKDTVFVYKSLNKTGHNRINANTSKVQYYRAPEKTKGDNKTQSHNNAIPKSKHHYSKYVPIKKDKGSLKVKEQVLVKDN